MQLVGKQLLILLNAKATGKKKNQTCSEFVEPVMEVITSKDMRSNTSNPLLRSYTLAKEGVVTGTHVLFRHLPSTDCQCQRCPSSCPCFLIDTLNTHIYKLCYCFFNRIKVKHFLTAQNLASLWQNEKCRKFLRNSENFLSAPLSSNSSSHSYYKVKLHTRNPSSEYIVWKSICFTISYFMMVLNSSKKSNK